MTVTSVEAASVQYFIVMALLFVAVLASRTSAEPQLDVGYYPFATESLQEMPEICYELGPVGKAMLLVMYGALFLVAAPCVFHEFASNMVQFSIAWLQYSRRSFFLSDPVRPVGGVEDDDGVDDARPSVLYAPTGP